jgi:hypothetical protein
MTDETLDKQTATDAAPEQTEDNQAPADKTFTQKEVDDQMARLRKSLTVKSQRTNQAW